MSITLPISTNDGDVPQKVVALVGPIASGKGTAAEWLIEQGYVPFNYGDIIYIERTARGLKEERKNSHAVAAELRINFGHAILAQKIIDTIAAHQTHTRLGKILIDGLRHPAEVELVKTHLQACMIGITASPEIRCHRALKRNRAVDPKLPAEFYEIDNEDRGINGAPHQNQIDACFALADVVIQNNYDDIHTYKRAFSDAMAVLSL